MAFHLGHHDPGNLSKALGQAAANKNALAETTHSSLGYSSGSPEEPAGIRERMAGDIIGSNLGSNGDFAVAVTDPTGAENLNRFVQLLYNGPFSPLPPPIM